VLYHIVVGGNVVCDRRYISLSILTAILQVNPPGLAGVYWSKGWRRWWWWQLDYWSYKSCKAPVQPSPPTNQHSVFFTSADGILFFCWHMQYHIWFCYTSHNATLRKSCLPIKWSFICQLTVHHVNQWATTESDQSQSVVVCT